MNLIHRGDPVFSRQFAFTITYHYLFPQLTMGLAPRGLPSMAASVTGWCMVTSRPCALPGAGEYALRVGLARWSIGAPLGLLYTLYVHRAFSGKILPRPDEV